MDNSTRIVVTCPLCGQKTLDYMKSDKQEVMQCFGCGYSTNSDMPESISSANELTPELKKFAQEANGKVWIPSMFQLDWGMLYPASNSESLMWGFSEMIDIPEEEQKNYPDGNGGFYTKRYADENETKFKDFKTALEWIKKQNNIQEQE